MSGRLASRWLLANAKHYRELLRAGRWFGNLSDEFQRRLLAAGVVKKMPKGEWLFSRGDLPSGLLKDLEGQGVVRLSYRHIEILDLDGLRRAATSGSPGPPSRPPRGPR